MEVKMEGEFKKRLYPDPTVDDLINRERVEEWLDEAKKEIFELAIQRFVDKCHPELWACLKKWFGDQ